MGRYPNSEGDDYLESVNEEEEQPQKTNYEELLAPPKTQLSEEKKQEMIEEFLREKRKNALDDKYPARWNAEKIFELIGKFST